MYSEIPMEETVRPLGKHLDEKFARAYEWYFTHKINLGYIKERNRILFKIIET
jgi:hypothetical protein